MLRLPALGVPPVFVGQGGSIPMVADFGKAFPEATILITAVGDPDFRPMAPTSHSIWVTSVPLAWLRL